MKLSRALRRRLDPWAVMLLGVLIVLGVIILLATPGPWHRVLPVTPRVPAAAPPRDVLVMVTRSADDQRCVGAIWVHVDYAIPSVDVVAVPARLTGLLPGAGMNALADVVGHGGPAAGAEAVGEALGVEFEGWIAVARDAVDEMLPMPGDGAQGSARRANVQRSQRAWSGSAPFAWAYAIQADDAARYAAAWRPRFFSRGSFTNFVLGSPDASTDMKLQTVSALAAAVDRTSRGRVSAGALPVVAYARRAYERVRPEPLAALVYRLAFTVDVPARRGARVRRAAVRPEVVLLTDAGTTGRAVVAAALQAVIHTRGRRDVRVVVVPCATRADVARALTESRGGLPPLAAVAAFGGSRGPATPPPGLLDVAADGARRSCLPLIVAVPRFIEGAGDDELAAVAGETGFPWVEGAIGFAEAWDEPAAAEELGRAAGECLVRAVSPRYFAPRLRATRAGFDYFDRGRLELAVAGGGPAVVEKLTARLKAMGYRPSSAVDDGTASASVPTVHFRAGSRSDALCLADDLGWPPSRVFLDTEAPATVTVVMPGVGSSL